MSISPAEMNAIEELPDKDKDIILPIIPLRGWVASKNLESSIPRIEKAIGERFWIADISSSFLEGSKNQLTGEYPRDVYLELEALLNPNDGYQNWFQYLVNLPRAIPTLQLGYMDQLRPQLDKLRGLNRGLLVKFGVEDINTGRVTETLSILGEMNAEDVFVVFDYGQVGRDVLEFAARIIGIIEAAHDTLPTAIIAVSCSSFPSSFSGSHRGENPIYERQLFRSVSQASPNVRMIYSDRGGARASKISGGGGIPSPRIDYPLTTDWRFIRKEFVDPKNPAEGEREKLYTEIAKQIMNADYWIPDLHVWGTQVIEFTSKGDEYGINSAAKATAVRLNIHMHQQLYFDAPIDLLDTDEDWVD